MSLQGQIKKRKYLCKDFNTVFNLSKAKEATHQIPTMRSNGINFSGPLFPGLWTWRFQGLERVRGAGKG